MSTIPALRLGTAWARLCGLMDEAAETLRAFVYVGMSASGDGHLGLRLTKCEMVATATGVAHR